MRCGLTMLILMVAAVTAPVAAQTIVGADVVDDKLARIDPSNLNATVVGAFGPTGSGFAMTGLAYDPTQGVLYGFSPSTSSLYTINLLTGAAAVIANLPGSGNANGLAVDGARGYVYISDNAGELFRFNIVTAELTTVGTISGGFTGVEGLGYDPVSDSLFGLADGDDRIIRIDPLTAAAVALPNVLVSGTWRGLDFDPSMGRLLATRVGGTSVLTSIDPVTGIGTDLGTLTGVGTFNFLQGLAVIPEPSTVALLSIGAVFVLLRFRRRR